MPKAHPVDFIYYSTSAQRYLCENEGARRVSGFPQKCFPATSLPSYNAITVEFLQDGNGTSLNFSTQNEKKKKS